ncbi:hypothetical protein HMPREF3190_00951, partial [Umbribacter vaginalis]
MLLCRILFKPISVQTGDMAHPHAPYRQRKTAQLERLNLRQWCGMSCVFMTYNSP